MKEVVTYIAQQLVEKPDKLTVSNVQLDGKMVIQVQVAPQDLQRIIGEQGKNFRALRNLATLGASQTDDIVVEIAS